MKKENGFTMGFTMVVSKIVEIFHWVGMVLLLAALICIFAAPQWLGYFIGLDAEGGMVDLTTYGLSINAPLVDGAVERPALVLAVINGILTMPLMAMVFRNLHLIVKKSRGSTPFQPDNVRMLREIGIFSVSIPLIGYAMSIIGRIIIGHEVAEISVNFGGFVMGLLVLCLTQFFVRGMELEKDMDGLL